MTAPTLSPMQVTHLVQQTRNLADAYEQASVTQVAASLRRVANQVERKHTADPVDELPELTRAADALQARLEMSPQDFPVHTAGRGFEKALAAAGLTDLAVIVRVLTDIAAGDCPLHGQHPVDVWSAATPEQLDRLRRDVDRSPAPGDVTIGGIHLRNVHNKTACDGRPCVIHNPTAHHMAERPLLWRDDRRIFERTCRHGIGHPDPDQFDYWQSVGREHESVHGCDGCCRTLQTGGGAAEPPEAAPPPPHAETES